MMADDSLFTALHARGIDQATINRFGFQATPHYYRDFPYWAYPVPDGTGHIVAWRGKAMDKKGAPMPYRWLTERMPSASWAVYTPQTIREAAALIIAAGEPDVWLLTALRLPAVTFLNGENSRPDPLGIGQIVARRPARCVVIYDNDEAGRSGSVTTVRALRQAGLEAVAKRLPDTLPEGGDVTDLYAACGQERAAFVAALGALDTMDVRDEAPRLTRQAVTFTTPGPIATFKEQYKLAAIAGQITELTQHASGRYLTGRCPFHDDKHPSFVVWPEIDKWRCFGCNRHGDQIDLIKEYKGLSAPPLPLRAAS